MNKNIHKIIKKLESSPVNASFDELSKILIHLGYKLSKGGTGTHRIFRKEGHDHINIPFAKPVKKHYVKKVLEIYEEENND